MVEEASLGILRWSFVSSGSIYLLPREKHKDPYCWLTTRLCCFSCGCKGGRKIIQDEEQQNVWVLMCFRSPLNASAVYSRGSGWCGTQLGRNRKATKLREAALTEASGSGSDCPQSSQYKWSHSSRKLWWAHYPTSAYTVSFMIWIGIGAIRAQGLGQILAQGCKSDQVYLLFVRRREQQNTKRSSGRLSSLTWVILSVFLVKEL